MKHIPFYNVHKDGKLYVKVEYKGEQKEFVSTYLECV